MKIEIPDYLQIGGHSISVEITDGVWEHEASGLYFPATKEIKIEERIDREAQEEVFIHEVIEAINSIYDLGVPHPVIQTLGIAIHQALVSGTTKREVACAAKKRKKKG